MLLRDIVGCLLSSVCASRVLRFLFRRFLSFGFNEYVGCKLVFVIKVTASTWFRVTLEVE